MSGALWSTAAGTAFVRRGVKPPRSAARLRAAIRAALDAASVAPEPGSTDDAGDLDDALTSAAEHVAAAIAHRGSAQSRTQLVSLLRRIEELRHELRIQPYRHRVEAIADARDGLDRLRAAASPYDVLRHAAEEVVRSCAFERSVVARADAGEWVIVGACFADDAAGAAAYVERLERDRVSLERAPLESEIMRRRAAALVDAETARDGMLASRDAPPPFTAHVASPVVVGDRLIAFLYGGVADGAPTELDRDRLRWFADGVAQLYERAALTAKLRAQRDHVHQMMSSTDTVMAELCEADIELRVGTPRNDGVATAASSVFVAPERRLELLLTRRELEVLALMAAGASNAAVAEQLVIAQGTVKSHVKHILRKLGAANRAEAVARYLHLYLGDHE